MFDGIWPIEQLHREKKLTIFRFAVNVLNDSFVLWTKLNMERIKMNKIGDYALI